MGKAGVASIWKNSCGSEPHFRSWLANALNQPPHPANLILSTRVITHMPTDLERKLLEFWSAAASTARRLFGWAG